MSIEQLTLDLSNKLGNKLNKNKEEIEIIKYGLFTIIHTSVAILLTAIVGLITGTFIEIMLISTTAALLKRYSGGIHASSPNRCIILGIILGLFLTIVCKYMLNEFNTSNIILFSGISISLVGYILYKKCPVGNKNKPLKKDHIRKRLRKKTFKFMTIVCICILILLLIYVNTGSYIIKMLITSIELGLMLQVFGLTSIGSKFINTMEHIFDHTKIV